MAEIAILPEDPALGGLVLIVVAAEQPGASVSGYVSLSAANVSRPLSVVSSAPAMDSG